MTSLQQLPRLDGVGDGDGDGLEDGESVTELWAPDNGRSHPHAAHGPGFTMLDHPQAEELQKLFASHASAAAAALRPDPA